MQQGSPWMSSWVFLQQAEAQTAANETEGKSQMLITQSSSLKVVRLIYLSSADVALSPVAVWNELIMNKMQRLCIAFIDVNSVKFAYSAGIEEQIYIRFAKTHLCGQV